MTQHFAPVDKASEEAEKNGKKAKRAGIIAGVVALVLIVGYVAGRQYFSTRFVPGTTVGGIDASNLTVEELTQQVEDQLAAYSDHVTGDGLDLTLSASDLGLSIDGAAWAQEARESADPNTWVADLFAHRTIEPTVGVDLDEEKLATTVTAAVDAYNQTATPPTNATASYDEETKAFVVVPDALGTELSTEAVVAKITRDATLLRSRTVIGESELATPAINAENEQLLAAVEKANGMLAHSYTLTLDGKDLDIAPVDSSITHSWISVVNGENGPEVVLDEHNSWQWCFDNLNAVVNGENETRVWEVESTQTAALLREALTAGTDGKLEVATVTMETRPEESEGARERGRHIDVNLTTQYARLYDENGNVLWRSPIVSGDASWGHNTPTGEFEINSMQTNVALKGLNNGATPNEKGEYEESDYYTSFVRYWMCFLGNEYGLHDADWRWEEEFGGETYLWNGSHGCVNLPVSKAEELYNLVHVGDKVIIHD